ncbi:hypothetical protein MKY51_06885 [Solibacillus sp. FSL R5-0691]|uniref:hypothetical protein n=1 Tax=unclassified Solibacillus TaxID=2637870 RepID=UPI0030D2D087
MVEQFDQIEIVQVLKRLEPIISYSSLQTRMENRDDLKQHLYEVTIKTLKNTVFVQPKGLFK